jgi:hypothetical protein
MLRYKCSSYLLHIIVSDVFFLSVSFSLPISGHQNMQVCKYLI